MARAATNFRSYRTIAYDVGFGDLSTFNREFRRHFGATPSDGSRSGARTVERPAASS
jgi:AraC-like DNA-binding protein